MNEAARMAPQLRAHGQPSLPAGNPSSPLTLKGALPGCRLRLSVPILGVTMSLPASVCPTERTPLAPPVALPLDHCLTPLAWVLLFEL